MTDTELNVMAALAIIGLSKMPNHGVQHARRNRNARHVVDEREEQILPNVPHGVAAQSACPHDPAEVAADESPALSIATSVPVPIAIPTSAWASAGASLIPSPAIATR